MSKKYKAGEFKLFKGYKPFNPSFINQEFEWGTPEIDLLLQEANTYLGKLNAYAELVPNVDFFIHMYALKEATESNMIEGTKTTFDEAVSPEENILPERRDDWQEVQNYTEALNYAIKELDNIPLSIRLLKEVHKILLSDVRGRHKAPGEIRKTQNWIGGSSLQDAFFVPPEPNDLPELLTDLEKFLHNENLLMPDLIKAGIAHYQFETIHPFLDGNGRVGRLLIILYLVERGLLNKPVLYISDFFERNRNAYYDSLSFVKTSSSLDQWLRFFLKGVIETSKNSIYAFEKIAKLRREAQQKVMSISRKPQRRIEFLNMLYSKPTLSVKAVSKEFNLSTPAANKLVKDFVDVGILQEKTGYKRNRYFVFEDYLKIFKD
ncbi:MAG: Fic family protein [uncultured bacterium]|nr:MAG: Fic family protein [uncultured bacterium]